MPCKLDNCNPEQLHGHLITPDVHLGDKNTARLQITNPPQSCLRELRANDGAWNFDTYQRRTFPSCSAPSETSSASVLPPGLSLVRLVGGKKSPDELAAELQVSVFPQLWGATPSSHVFPPVTGRSARGRKGSQLFQPGDETSSAAPTKAETVTVLWGFCCYLFYIHLSLLLFFCLSFTVNSA